MKKLLHNSQLKNKTLKGRNDLSKFEKTAIHYFHEEANDTFIKWYDILSSSEQIQVKNMFKISDEFILRQRKYGE